MCDFLDGHHAQVCLYLLESNNANKTPVRQNNISYSNRTVNWKYLSKLQHTPLHTYDGLQYYHKNSKTNRTYR